MVLFKKDVHVQVSALSLSVSFCLSLFLSPLLHVALLSSVTLCHLRSDKEEHVDLKNYKIKAQNGMKKRKILSSVYVE